MHRGQVTGPKPHGQQVNSRDPTAGLIWALFLVPSYNSEKPTSFQPRSYLLLGLFLIPRWGHPHSSGVIHTSLLWEATLWTQGIGHDVGIALLFTRHRGLPIDLQDLPTSFFLLS